MSTIGGNFGLTFGQMNKKMAKERDKKLMEKYFGKKDTKKSKEKYNE